MDDYHYRDWVDDLTKELMVDFLEEGQMLYFQFKNRDYLIEQYVDGFLIADPIPYYNNGGYAADPRFQYPGSFQAKTSEEILALPFLDNKTMLQQFDEIRFWNY
jgi:hypothetical protein